MDKNAKNKQSNKIQGRFRKFFYIGILVVSIVLLIVEGFVYYQRTYLTPFWVNGQSMYPTLNGNAKTEKGEDVGKEGASASAGYIVDYGVMDCHKSVIKKLKRFDVVVTQYSKDDTSNKIKRIVGLPGERIKFNTTDANGELFVNGKHVEQPLETENIRNGYYPTEEVTLGSDEYYVLGDNRNHSLDSRAEGPIKKEWINGKAMYICGTAEVFLNSEMKLDIKNIKYRWPRRIK